MSAGALELSELLTIDVAAELRKLALGTLAGPWEVPTQLARWAGWHAATRVDLKLGRNTLEFVAEGATLDAELLHTLAGALDERAAPGARHVALVALESAPGPSLLGLLALEPRAFELRSGGLALLRRAGQSPRLASQRASADTRLRLTGLRLDRARARAELLGAGRFAHVPLHVDGQDARTGFAGAWAEAPLPSPLSGRLALVSGLRSSRLRLTVGGIVSAHLTVPGAPPFDAVVSADRWAHAQGPAGLREAVQPHVRTLVDAAVALLLREASGPRGGATAAESDLRHGLLTAARRRLRLSEVLQVPLIEARGPAARAGLLSLIELGHEAELRRGTPIEALEPGQDPARFVLRAPLWLVADAETRSRLLELLGLRFVTPARHEAPALGSRLGARLRDLPGALLRSWAKARGRAALPETHWTGAERRLVEELRALLRGREAPQAVWLCAGGGLPFLRRRETLELWLPREATLVRMAGQALERDRSLAAAALAALSAAGGSGSSWPS